MKPEAIVDMQGNKLEETSGKTRVTRYIYISDAAKALAETSGQATLYTTLTGVGVSLCLSLALY